MSSAERRENKPVGRSADRCASSIAPGVRTKGHRRSLRDIARELAGMGYVNKRGAPYSASCVKSMVESERGGQHA
jgi:hypothetical protein